MRIYLSIAIAIAVLWAGALFGLEPGAMPAKAPACVELPDQFDTPQKLTFPATNITILTIADRKGSGQVDGWIAVLKGRYAGRVDIRGLAACGGAPAFVQGRIRRKFQETRKYPVMMDWSGKVGAQFGYQPNVANLLVLGRDGAILGRFSGSADGPSVAGICAVVDNSLLHPPPGLNSHSP